MSVQVEQLTKLYGRQRAVDDISFTVERGQIMGFLGPNGAGKSTTMKIITCFIPQSTGKVTVSGHDVSTDPMVVRRKVGYLPESNPLYHDMFVREYLGFVGRVHKVPQLSQRIAEMIEMTGLGREMHKKIGQLSKGYKQRVGLAQAMLHDPEVLILDEPTAGLDPNQLSEIRQVIRRMGQEKTVILSTHIMQEVQAMCDRVIIINRGQLVADDTTAHLTQRAEGEATVMAGFKESVQEAQLKQIAGVSFVHKNDDGTWLITAKEPQGDLREAVFRFAKENNLTLLTLYREQSSLEDVFRRLTN